MLVKLYIVYGMFYFWQRLARCSTNLILMLLVSEENMQNEPCLQNYKMECFH